MNKIKFIRELRGYPQEAIAEKLSMSQNTYSRYESHPKKFSEEQINELAKIFGVDRADLLNDEPVILNLHNTNGTNGYIQTENFYFNTKDLIDKLLQAKDELIKSKEEEIIVLKKVNEDLRDENKWLKTSFKK